MDSREGWRLGHRPGLDGLRGVAVLLVIGSHSIHAAQDLGGVGVTLFFTLSGFLITALLLHELDDTGRIDLRRFYARRARRLFPALAALLGVVLVLALLGIVNVRPLAVLVAATYGANWVEAYGGTHFMGALGHTWSLAVEEQFYLAWPVLVVVASRLPRPRVVMTAVCVGGIAWAWVVRVLLWNAGDGVVRMYFRTDTRVDALLVGCLLALAATRSAEWRGRPAVGAGILFAVPPVVLAVSVLAPVPAFMADYLLWPLVVPLVAAGVIAMCTGTDQRGPLSTPWLRYVGRRSYALYLWHVPIAYAVHAALGGPLAVVVIVGASFALAEASWRLVERPVARRRARPRVLVAQAAS